MTLLWRPLAHPDPQDIPTLNPPRLIPFFMQPYCCTDRCSSCCFAWLVAVGCCHWVAAAVAAAITVGVSVIVIHNLAVQCRVYGVCSGSTKWRPQRPKCIQHEQSRQKIASKNCHAPCVCCGQGGNPRLLPVKRQHSTLDPFIRRRTETKEKQQQKSAAALIAACNMRQASYRPPLHTLKMYILGCVQGQSSENCRVVTQCLILLIFLTISQYIYMLFFFISYIFSYIK